MIFDWNWVVCTISVVVANLSCLALCSFLFSILPSKRNLLTHLETVLVLAMTAFVNGLVSGLLSYQFQGSIDFKTANIHRTVGMYFLVFTGNIEWYDLQGQYHLIHLLLPGECIGKYFPRDSISWYTRVENIGNGGQLKQYKQYKSCSETNLHIKTTSKDKQAKFPPSENLLDLGGVFPNASRHPSSCLSPPPETWSHT